MADICATVAYTIGAQDDDTSMLGDDTYKPATLEFHDVRYGVDGVPHQATCGRCGRKNDPEQHPLLLAGPGTAMALKAEKLRGLEMREVVL